MTKGFGFFFPSNMKLTHNGSSAINSRVITMYNGQRNILHLKLRLRVMLESASCCIVCQIIPFPRCPPKLPLCVASQQSSHGQVFCFDNPILHNVTIHHLINQGLGSPFQYDITLVILLSNKTSQYRCPSFPF